MRGRKRLYGTETETAELSVIISKDIIDHLSEIGGRLGMSAPQYVRSLLHQHVAKISKGTP